ncbi:MAG: sugar-binding protein [Ketobacteraceae bacterium]|nr:sugar-binding protein [Ketobacteraceae bacterium]
MFKLRLSRPVALVAFILLGAMPVISYAEPRGAHELPYQRYEAELTDMVNGTHVQSASLFEQDKTASEASRQQYREMGQQGDSISWIMDSGGSGVTLRFTLPDSPRGTGREGAVDVLVNGEYQQTVNLSSYYAWQYFVHSEPENQPGGRPRMRFDEVHFRLGRTLDPGDRIELRKARQDGIPYGIDFIEVEPVPAPLPQPAGYVAITEFGAVPDDDGDDLAAMEAALREAQARGTGVYLPPGRFVFNNKLLLNISNIAIQGAGIWYTELFFSNPEVFSGGILARADNVDISHFYMNTVNNRRFASPGRYMIYKAFMGTYGNHSRIHNIWAEHFEVGAWLGGYDAPYPVDVTRNLVISHSRFRNNYADGINFSQGTSNSIVEHTNIRNSGDDGLAIWTSNSPAVPEGVENIFRYNTVEHVYRAGGVAIFGGRDHRAHHLIIRDCFAGSGMRFTTDFPGYSFSHSGMMSFHDITIQNCGTSYDLWDQKRGAIEFNTPNGVRNMAFRDIDILNAQRHGVQLVGNNFSNITFDRIDIEGAGGDAVSRDFAMDVYGGLGIMAQAGSGTVRFDNTYITGVEDQAYLNRNTGFNLLINTGSTPNNQNDDDVLGNNHPDTDIVDTGGESDPNGSDDDSASDDSDGECPAGSIGNISQNPLVDGQIEDLWYRQQPTAIHHLTVGTRSTDFQGQWRLLASDQALYVLVEVTDRNLHNDSGNNWWDDDAIEIFLDANHSAGSAYDGYDDIQMGFRAGDARMFYGYHSVNAVGSIDYAMATTADGYRLELAIPWSALGGRPQQNHSLGFDIAVDDDDNGGGRDAQYTAYARDPGGWRNPSVFGTVSFSDCGDSLGGGAQDDENATEDGPVTHGSVYHLDAKHSGKSLDVSHISVHPGASIHQWHYVGGRNQQWITERVGERLWQLRSVHSDLCLTVAGGGQHNGSNLIQHHCNGSAEQLFSLEDQGNGYYYLRARHSGRCVDVSHIAHHNGANIHQWECIGQDNAKWRFVKVPQS